MRKKILDAALLFAFALCLIVTSNIQEEAAYVAELENEAVPLQNQEQSRKKCNFPLVWQLQFPQIHLPQNQMKKQVLKRKMLF